jgi:hypothetical protein
MTSLSKLVRVAGGSLVLATLAAAMPVLLPGPAHAVEYLSICKKYGAGWYYLPGDLPTDATSTCVNVQTGETRTESPTGTETVANRMDFAFQGVSIALAMPTAIVGEDKTFAIAGRLGIYEQSKAVGLAGSLRLTDGLTIGGGLAVGIDQNSIGSRAGMNFSW